MATMAPAALAAHDDPSCTAQSSAELPSGARLHEIFEARVAEGPSRVAISAGDTTTSYGELDARANRVAHTLRDLGVGPETRVGLLVRPSVDMIAGMVGILKAGAAYVPIDPEYPPGRIRFLLQDSSVSAIVTAGETGDALEGLTAPVVSLSKDDGSGQESADRLLLTGTESSHNLAYIIYTSGSTGTPKGVMVEHRNVVRLFQQTDAWFHFGPEDVWPLLHSISFDFSVWEIWGALLHGGRLVIVPETVRRSPLTLISLLRSERVTVLNQTPSAFRQLLSADLAQENAGGFSLRLIVFGGEKLEPKLLEPWIARYGDDSPALVNMYGITETTVHVTYRRIVRSDVDSASPSPIGIPIPDLEIHLLDDAQQPVADGVAGEIYVSGPGVARGYWNLPALTAERFVTVSGVRMYRSGDRGIRSGTGELYYIDRTDAQIKVRGYRIEPGEVECSLSRHAGVATAIVVPIEYGEGDTRLEAYIAPVPGAELTPETISRLTGELTDAAKRDLPLHLRPSAYHFISQIPLTAHGKADREALRLLRGARSEPPTIAVQTRTATEATVLEIAEGVLQRAGIQLDDDLFDIGATSLALTRILLQINSSLGVKLTGQELTDAASVSALAACADAQLGTRNLTSVA